MVWCNADGDSVIPAFPKPSQIRKQKPAVKVMPDGREILDLKTKAGADEYQRRKQVMWERQDKRCALQITPQCKARQGRWPFNETQFDHERGRGGGKQDDRIEVGGIAQNATVCAFCNSLKGSRRIPYIDTP